MEKNEERYVLNNNLTKVHTRVEREKKQMITILTCLTILLLQALNRCHVFTYPMSLMFSLRTLSLLRASAISG